MLSDCLLAFGFPKILYFSVQHHVIKSPFAPAACDADDLQLSAQTSCNTAAGEAFSRFSKLFYDDPKQLFRVKLWERAHFFFC